MNMRCRSAVGLLVTLALFCACTLTSSPDEDRIPDAEGRAERSDAALGAAIRAGRPGCSGAVGVQGDLVWTGALGVADLESGAELTPETVFDIGKVSNQFTATTVLLLAIEGELRLEDPVSAYLDGRPAWAAQVTIDDLVHHTSGLPDYVDLLLDRGHQPEDVTTQGQAMEAVAAVAEPRFEPGSAFRYSSTDYLLLAEIVHVVTGTPLPQVLAERVFEPLDLEMTMDPVASFPGKAVSYRRTVGGFEPVDWAWEQVGDGGIQTTPSELVRWADNYRTGRLGGSALRYAQLAGAARTSLSVSERLEIERYGAGFFIGIDGGLSDLGQWEGYTTALEITPDRRVAAAVACNNDWLVPSATATILTVIWSS
jgi:CubicO group peptidase (beta-lactamase class C family)